MADSSLPPVLRRIVPPTGAPPDPGPLGAGEFHRVAVADLRIDDSYQRPMAKHGVDAVRKIAANFRWERFVPIVVSRRTDGTLVVVDGQHRTHAAAFLGITHVPAWVVGLTASEEAAAFSWINGQVMKVSIYHVYKAALASGEAWAEAARDAVAAAGCELLTYPMSSARREPGRIQCVGLVRDMLAAGRGDTLRLGLAALRVSANGDNPDFYADWFLRPWFAALQTLQVTEKAGLATFVGGLEQIQLLRAVDRLAADPKWLRQARWKLLQAVMVAQMRKAGW